MFASNCPFKIVFSLYQEEKKTPKRIFHIKSNQCIHPPFSSKLYHLCSLGISSDYHALSDCHTLVIVMVVLRVQGSRVVDFTSKNFSKRRFFLPYSFLQTSSLYKQNRKIRFINSFIGRKQKIYKRTFIELWERMIFMMMNQ